jgi:hypothetical protein
LDRDITINIWMRMTKISVGEKSWMNGKNFSHAKVVVDAVEAMEREKGEDRTPSLLLLLLLLMPGQVYLISLLQANKVALKLLIST